MVSDALFCESCGAELLCHCQRCHWCEDVYDDLDPEGDEE